MNRAPLAPIASLVLATATLLIACSSDDQAVSETGPQSTAAAVAGAADGRCVGRLVVVDPAACQPAADGGKPDGEGTHTHSDGDGDEYGATLFGSEGDDDHCKYRVKWTASPVSVGADVTLAIVATNRIDASPVAGAKPYAEIFLTSTKPGPNTPVKTTETAPGSYTIGPVRFDQPGKWTVRFHFSADCADGDSSPHGHIAFLVNVP